MLLDFGPAGSPATPALRVRVCACGGGLDFWGVSPKTQVQCFLPVSAVVSVYVGVEGVEASAHVLT